MIRYGYYVGPRPDLKGKRFVLKIEGVPTGAPERVLATERMGDPALDFAFADFELVAPIDWAGGEDLG